jgi:hypothetical protein
VFVVGVVARMRQTRMGRQQQTRCLENKRPHFFLELVLELDDLLPVGGGHHNLFTKQGPTGHRAVASLSWCCLFAVILNCQSES